MAVVVLLPSSDWTEENVATNAAAATVASNAADVVALGLCLWAKRCMAIRFGKNLSYSLKVVVVVAAAALENSSWSESCC